MDRALIREHSAFGFGWARQSATDFRFPFRTGRFCRGDRLYYFQSEELVVLERWPKLRAWRLRPDRPGFERIDPDVRIGDRLLICMPWDGSVAYSGDDDFNDSRQNLVGLSPLPSSYDESGKCYTFAYARAPLDMVDADALDEHERCHQFVEAIPLPMLSRATRFEDGQWRLIYLCTHIPELLGLIDSHPVLAHGLARAEHFRDGHSPKLAALRRVIKTSPEEIAGWLGFLETRRTVRVLTKILPSASNFQALLAFRKILADPLRKLDLLSVIDSKTLALLTKDQFARLVSFRFIVEFSALPKSERNTAFSLLDYARRKKLRDYAPLFPFDCVGSLIGKAYELIARFLLVARVGSRSRCNVFGCRVRDSRAVVSQTASHYSCVVAAHEKQTRRSRLLSRSVGRAGISMSTTPIPPAKGALFGSRTYSVPGIPFRHSMSWRSPLFF